MHFPTPAQSALSTLQSVPAPREGYELIYDTLYTAKGPLPTGRIDGQEESCGRAVQFWLRAGEIHNRFCGLMC